ncbi:MAG TPA: hypothetical protein VHL09_13490, partial [Dehalococcoidia bacterium]|nr:hypothetical protein [Dehalococcoidia bacterium]
MTKTPEIDLEDWVAERGKTLPPGPITFEKFLAWCDEDIRAEWVDGEIIVMTSPASDRHQDIAD